MANDDAASVTDGGSVVVNVLANDWNVNPSSMYIVQPADKGYLNIIGNGEIRYTHYAGAGTADRFTYTVAGYDGVYRNPATVRLTVGSSGPVRLQTQTAGNVVSDGGSVVIQLVSDTSQYDLSTVYIKNPANHGYLAAVNNGTVRYNHYAGSGNSDRFSYVVADYRGNYSQPA